MKVSLVLRGILNDIHQAGNVFSAIVRDFVRNGKTLLSENVETQIPERFEKSIESI